MHSTNMITVHVCLAYRVTASPCSGNFLARVRVHSGDRDKRQSVHTPSLSAVPSVVMSSRHATGILEASHYATANPRLMRQFTGYLRCVGVEASAKFQSLFPPAFCSGVPVKENVQSVSMISFWESTNLGSTHEFPWSLVCGVQNEVGLAWRTNRTAFRRKVTGPRPSTFLQWDI
jgi:hypothetical protein